MNNYLVLNIGDVLSRPKLPFVEHVGVVVGPDTVLHNTPQKGEHVSNLAEFAAGEKIAVRRTQADAMRILARSRTALSRPQKYDLATRNCEHTVSEILWGIAKSPTVILVVLVAAVAVLYLGLRGR